MSQLLHSTLLNLNEIHDSIKDELKLKFLLIKRMLLLTTFRVIAHLSKNIQEAKNLFPPISFKLTKPGGVLKDNLHRLVH